MNNQISTTLYQQQSQPPPTRRIPIKTTENTMMKDHNWNDHINHSNNIDSLTKVNTVVGEPIPISPLVEKNHGNISNKMMTAKKKKVHFDHSDDHNSRRCNTASIIRERKGNIKNSTSFQKIGHDSVNDNYNDNIRKNKNIKSIKKVGCKHCENGNVDLEWNIGDEDEDNVNDDVDNIDDDESLEIISSSERQQRMMRIKEALRKRLERKQEEEQKTLRFKSTSASLIGSVKNTNNKKKKRMINRYNNTNVKVSPIKKHQQQKPKPSLLSSIRNCNAIQKTEGKPYRSTTKTTTTTTTTTTSTSTIASNAMPPLMSTTTTNTKIKTKKRVYNHLQRNEFIKVEKKTNHHHRRQSNTKHDVMERNHSKHDHSSSQLQMSSSLPFQIMKNSMRIENPMLLSEQNELLNYSYDNNYDRNIPLEVAIGIFSSSSLPQQQNEEIKQPTLRSNISKRWYTSDDIDQTCSDITFDQMLLFDIDDYDDDDDQRGTDTARQVLKRLKKKTEKANAIGKQVKENIRNVKRNECNDKDMKIAAISKNTGSRQYEKIQSLMLQRSNNEDNKRKTNHDVFNDHDEEEDAQYKHDSQQSQMNNICDDNIIIDDNDDGEFEFIDDDLPMVQESMAIVIENEGTTNDPIGCDCPPIKIVTNSDRSDIVEFSSRLENIIDQSKSNTVVEQVNCDNVINNSSHTNIKMNTLLCNDDIFLEQAACDLADVNWINLFGDHSMTVSSVDIKCKPSLVTFESNLHSSVKSKKNIIMSTLLSTNYNHLHQQSTVAGCIVMAEVSMDNSNISEFIIDSFDKCSSGLNEQQVQKNDSSPNGSRCFGITTNRVVSLTPLDNEISSESDDIWTNVSKPVLQYLSSSKGSSVLSAILDREFPLVVKDNDRPCSLPLEWNDVFGDWTDRLIIDTEDDIEESTSSLLQRSPSSITLGENDVHWWTNDTISMMMYYRQQAEQETMAERQKNSVVDEKEMTPVVDDNISVLTNDTLLRSTNDVMDEDRATSEKDKDLKLLLDSYLSQMPAPRFLTKLRRILLPMILQVVVVKESNNNKNDCHTRTKSKYSRCSKIDGFNHNAAEDLDQCRPYVKEGSRTIKAEDRVCVGLYPLKESLAELWLGCRRTCHKILPVLLKLSMKIPYCDEEIIEDPLMRYHATYFSTQSRYQYQEIQNLVIQVLRKADMKYRYCGIELRINSNLRFGDIPKDAFQRRIFDDFQTFFLKHHNEDNRVETKRQDMIASFYNVGDKNVPKESLVQGYVLQTEEEDGMTEEQFLRETYLMNKVNESFPRHFIPLVSRPRFAQIPHSDHIDIQLRRLHFSLFNADGSLKESVFTDVSKIDKHYFITFSNSNGGGKDDQRWQIPFLGHTTKGKCKTREVIEKVVTKMNLMNPEKEHLHDLGILIGGTVDQSLHHDTSRQWTIWKHHRNERKRSTTTNRKQNESNDDSEQQLDESVTVGWEANRLVYNDAMADPFAPSSFLIGLNLSNISGGKDNTAMTLPTSSHSSNRSIYIGVQNDQIDRISENKCRIKDGMPYEEYHIVRESDDVVVLEVHGGCSFTGDFQHAGVRNVIDGTDDAKLMDRLFRNVQRIVTKYETTEYVKQNHDKVGKQRSNEILRLFSKFQGLDRLCRLHFSTKLNNSKMIVPKNAIGFHNCIANGQS